MDEAPDKQSREDQAELTPNVLPADAPPVAAELERARRIDRQVQREMRRRKGILAFYVGLLALTLLMGLAVILFGASDSEEVARRTSNVARTTAEETAKNTANAALSSMNQQAKDIQENLNTVKGQVENVNKRVMTNQPNISELLSRLPTPGIIRVPVNGNYPSIPISNANSNANSTEQFRYRYPQVAAAIANIANNQSNTGKEVQGLRRAIFGGSTPDLGLDARLAMLEQSMESNEQTVRQLTATLALINKRLDALEKLIGGSKPTVAARSQLTYQVKEESTAVLYDLGIKIKLGNQKNGVISSIEVYDLKGQLLISKENIGMGAKISFLDRDKKVGYLLVPAYIHRRRLVKDFIGFSIQQAAQ